MGKFSDDDFFAIRKWVLDGCIAVRSELTFRFQKTYPKTLCMFWVRPQIPGFVGRGSGIGAWACLDCHYDSRYGDRPKLGGFWINGVDEQDLKPEQEFAGNTTNNDAYSALKALFPKTMPKTEGHLLYKTYITSLYAHKTGVTEAKIMEKVAGFVKEKYFS